MHTVLLLLTLTQFDGLSMFTDREGVVHVVASRQAPAGATRLEGGSYSVIDADGRAPVMLDGGARAEDSAWWRARFEEARQGVQAGLALEERAARDVQEAQREVCASATATSSARVTLVTRRRAHRGLRALVVEDHDQQTTVNCRRGTASAALITALQTRRSEREQAERALRRLEQEALAERVPLRDWY